MLSLNLDTKLIVGAVLVLALLAAIGGAVLFHETQLGRLRAQLENERASRREAVARGEKLEALVRENAAEVEAANRAALAAKRQARCVGEIGRSADRARAKNREVVHEAAGLENSASNLAASLEAERRAALLRWNRVNELFLRDAGAASAAADRCSRAAGLCAPDAP